MSQATLMSSDKCQMYEFETTINMCETGEIGELQVTGVLNSCDVTSNAKYTLITVESCVYAFIITEVVTNKNESFIEVYSPNYVNTIITQEFSDHTLKIKWIHRRPKVPI